MFLDIQWWFLFSDLLFCNVWCFVMYRFCDIKRLMKKKCNIDVRWLDLVCIHICTFNNLNVLWQFCCVIWRDLAASFYICIQKILTTYVNIISCSLVVIIPDSEYGLRAKIIFVLQQFRKSWLPGLRSSRLVFNGLCSSLKKIPRKRGSSKSESHLL